jgi:hypothetical protein
LQAAPRTQKFHRAIWHTYIEPAPTQEQAAAQLELPFNTYRYHLVQGIARITAWLWQRELAEVSLPTEPLQPEGDDRGPVTPGRADPPARGA